jgi:hypothetical protein
MSTTVTKADHNLRTRDHQANARRRNTYSDKTNMALVAEAGHANKRTAYGRRNRQ